VPAQLISHVIKIGRSTRAGRAIAMENGEFENTIHIDSERNVIYDYSG
jgi:hypothetical protein